MTACTRSRASPDNVKGRMYAGATTPNQEPLRQQYTQGRKTLQLQQLNSGLSQQGSAEGSAEVQNRHATCTCATQCHANAPQRQAPSTNLTQLDKLKQKTKHYLNSTKHIKQHHQCPQAAGTLLYTLHATELHTAGSSMRHACRHGHWHRKTSSHIFVWGADTKATNCTASSASSRRHHARSHEHEEPQR